uniref:BCL3 transcription coactivator n=1 Tax=Salvator merianae TaxID=96440 RepID=A0A8D0BQH4_SALMN
MVTGPGSAPQEGESDREVGSAWSESLPLPTPSLRSRMAGELPVDLSTWRKGERQDRWVPSDGEAAAAGGPSSEGEAPRAGQRTPSSQKPPTVLVERAPSSVCRTHAGTLPPEVQRTASPQAGAEGEKKLETSLPLRKRRYAVHGAADGDSQGPLAGKAPKTESSKGETEAWIPPCNGYCPPYISLAFPRVPAAYYPGLTVPYLAPELPPVFHSVTPQALLEVSSPYSMLCSVEPQLALDIAMATKQDEDGDTPLHIAVVQGNLLIVRQLITLFRQGQRDLDTFNNLRQTPLHLAVITAQSALVKLLLACGASPMVLDRNGQTALHLACEHGSLQCLQELLDGSPTPLDLEARNFEGFTPLHIAVGTSNQDLTLTLLEHGADIDAVDIKSGRSPLLHAVENNNLDVVELLLQHGANVNAQSYGGNTALHAASGRGLLDMLRLLVRNGADSSLKNYHNDTPLMVAKNKRVIDILRGKASRPGLTPESMREGSSPARSAASSPVIRSAHTGLLSASPDSCPTTPSPALTPKPHSATPSPNITHKKPESITLTNGPSATGPLQEVKLEKSPTPPMSDHPAGFPGASKFFLPGAENVMDPNFQAVLYPFAASNHNLTPPHLQLLPIGLNHSVLPPSWANPVHPRGRGVDQSRTLLDSESLPITDLEGRRLQSRYSRPRDS